MKKFLLTILSFIFVCDTLTAQDLEPNIFGIRAGLNSSSVSSDKSSNFIYRDYTVDYINYNTSTQTGFNIGLSYQRLLDAILPFYLETGLYLSNKGFKQNVYFNYISDSDFQFYEVRDNYKTSLTYIQIPFLLNYHFIVADNIKIEPFAGLYIAYGISGKTKLGYRHYNMDGGAPWQFQVEDAFGKDNFKKFDTGFQIGMGATLYNIYVGIGYELGASNMGGKYYEGFSVKNKNLSINLGYNISLNKNKNVKNKFNRIYPNAE
jgi:hypothetical protein